MESQISPPPPATPKLSNEDPYVLILNCKACGFFHHPLEIGSEL